MSEFVNQNSNTTFALNKVNTDNKDIFVTQEPKQSTNNNAIKRKLFTGLACASGLAISTLLLRNQWKKR